MIERKTSLTRTLTVLCALMLAMSGVGPLALAGSGSAAPAGMSNIPSNAISEDVPTKSDMPITADQLDGKVMASDYADSLAVTLTTNKRASELISSDSAVAQGNQMALILSDDQHSEGRRVAIDSGILQDALGYEPQAIYGTHESGEQWSAPAQYTNGYLVFDVPHFSTNTVTFSGEVSIQASNIQDNTQFEYQLSNESIPKQPQLHITGTTNTRSESLQLSAAADGDEINVPIGGTKSTQVNLTFSAPDNVVLQQWNYAINSDISDTAIDSTSNSIYVATDTEIIALDIKSGSLEWKNTLPINSTLDIEFNDASNTLYVTSGYKDGSTLYALDTASDGSLQNTASNFPAGNVNTVTTDGSTVYVGATDGAVYALGSGSNFGAKQWSNDISSYPIYSITTGTNSNAVYAQDSSGSIIALDKSASGSVSWVNGEAESKAMSITSADQPQTLDVSDYSRIEASLRAANGFGGGSSDNGGPGGSGGSGAVGSVSVDVSTVSDVLLTPADGRNGYNDGQAGSGGQTSNAYPNQIYGGDGGDGGGSTAISANSNVLAAAGGGGGGGGGDEGSYDGGSGGDGGGPGGGNGGAGGGQSGEDGSIYTASNSEKLSDSVTTSDKIVITSLIPKTQGPMSSCIGNLEYEDNSNHLYSLTNPCVDSSADSSTVNRIDTANGGIVNTNTLSNGVSSISSSPESGNPIVGLSNGNIKEISNSENLFSYESSSVTPTSSVSVGESGKWVLLGSGQSVEAIKGNIQADTPAVSLGGQTVTVNQKLGPGETATKQITLPAGENTGSLSLKSGRVNIDMQWLEKTETKNPEVTISTSQGETTALSTQTIAKGETIELSNQIDKSILKGDVTISVSLSKPTNGPPATADLTFSHVAQTKLSTDYQSSTFEESYNISRTYADATDDAQITIPYASERVVGVKRFEYRINGGSWESISPADRRFENTTVTAYLSQVNGAPLPAGATVEVRATGRKINVENGAVNITDPTKPGEELDTQLKIQSRSEGFSVDVGPTDDGKRVHYAYSNDYPTKDYVVISADGSQRLYLPESQTGDKFRIQHLRTKVNALNGDVRIGVKEPGSEPELKVAPGPGGSGDDVEITYYNTQSGVEYLLNSITRSIVIDSDTAQSPVVFEDDDDEEIWTILRDSAPSGEASSGSALAGAGQFVQRQSSGISGALGAISLPIPDSIPQPILLLIIGIGGFVVVRRLGIFGGGSSSGSADDQPSGIIASLQRAISGASSGLLRGLRGLLNYIGDILSIVLSNRRATIVGSIALAIGAAQSGLLSLPDGTGILLVVAGIPVASWLILRSRGAVSQRVWLASTLAAVILGLEFVASGTIQTAIEQLTSENVAPLLILAGAGALYLWYRQRQTESNTPDTVNRLIFNGDDD